MKLLIEINTAAFRHENQSDHVTRHFLIVKDVTEIAMIVCNPGTLLRPFTYK